MSVEKRVIQKYLRKKRESAGKSVLVRDRHEAMRPSPPMARQPNDRPHAQPAVRQLVGGLGQRFLNQ